MMSASFKHDKSIKALEKKAKKGGFYSALELSNNFKIGKFVEIDINKSDYYLNLAYNNFKRQDLKLKSIKINNYRLFDNISLDDFDSSLNIFIGNNGAGKTSLLDAMALSLSWLSINISKNGGSGDYIDIVDINNYTDAVYSTITSVIHINKNISASLELSQFRNGIDKTIKNKLIDFRLIGSFYKEANRINPNFNLPLLAYYNVMRSYDVNPKDFKGLDDLLENTLIDKFDGYQKSLTGKTDFKAFIKWYKKLDDILLREKKTERGFVDTVSSFELSEDFLDTFKYFASVNDAFKDKYKELEIKLNEIKDRKENENISYSKLKQYKNIIDDVIYKFMDGFSNIEVRIEPMIDLVINKKNKEISVMRLSQGEKTLLALILDITRRLIVLNPSLDDPLEGQGIILIDEFDLHLHPQWQKNIATNLKSTFPNCQFFLTTHSPIVISEVDRKHIYILDTIEDSIFIRRPSQTYGLTANDILNELMGPDDGKQIIRANDVEEKLEEIFSLLSNEDNKSINLASKKIEELELLLNGDIPELVRAKVQRDLLKELL
ncbi:AAA family ATPase [Proteus sp. CD3]|uniref:AAA family ATPase n=1 Tax=Proteus sp. CD3 TaxID=1921565 RepID=UPI0022401356|nr:AAA family ATPase [Proteus sp. CD3]